MEKIIDVQYYNNNFYKCKLLGYYTSKKYNCDFIAFHRLTLPNKIFYVPVFYKKGNLYIFRNNQYLFNVLDTIKEEASELQSKNLNNFKFEKIFLDPELEKKKIILPKINIEIYETILNDGKEVVLMDLSCLHIDMKWLSKKDHNVFINKVNKIISRNQVIGNYAIVSIRDLSELYDQCSNTVIINFKTTTKKIDCNYNLLDSKCEPEIKLDDVSEEVYFTIFRKIFENIFARLNKVIDLNNYEAGKKFAECYRDGKFLITTNDRLPYCAIMKYMSMILSDLIKEIKNKPVKNKDMDLEINLLFYYIENTLAKLQVNEYLDSISTKYVAKKKQII